MAATKESNLIQFCLMLAEECPGKVRPSEVERFLALAKKHGKMAVKECSVGLTEADKRREKVIEQEMVAIAVSQWGLPSIKFGGDPRGFTVKLILGSKRYNTWGGEEEGWGVVGS